MEARVGRRPGLLDEAASHREAMGGVADPGRTRDGPGTDGPGTDLGQSQVSVVAPESYPWASSQRSASMAAAQPVPAAVTACR